MLLLGAGERGEGLGRPEFVMRRRRHYRRGVRILAILPPPPPPPTQGEIIWNKGKQGWLDLRHGGERWLGKRGMGLRHGLEAGAWHGLEAWA
mgnify:CR=1 FL=1